MKTVIVYVSTHHGNTKKLVDAIAAEYDVATYDVISGNEIDLSGYDCIGIASGVAYGKYYPEMLRFLESSLPDHRKVFFLHTAGDPRVNHANGAKAITDARGCENLGVYFCKGFDTYGPFRLVGGICKGHPTEEEVQEAVAFYKGICGKADESDAKQRVK